MGTLFFCVPVRTCGLPSAAEVDTSGPRQGTGFPPRTPGALGQTALLQEAAQGPAGPVVPPLQPRGSEVSPDRAKCRRPPESADATPDAQLGWTFREAVNVLTAAKYTSRKIGHRDHAEVLGRRLVHTRRGSVSVPSPRAKLAFRSTGQGVGTWDRSRLPHSQAPVSVADVVPDLPV